MDEFNPSTSRSPDASATPSQFGNHPLSAAQWIRASADGEADGATKPADLPADAEARLGFDRTLRECCSRTLGSVTCPDAVRRAVIEAMAAEQAAPALSITDETGVIRTPMGDTRSPSFWSRAGRFGAIAAVVALGVSVAYKGITTGSLEHAMPAQQASLLASFVEQRHEKCPTDEKELDAEFAAHSEDDAASTCMTHLGSIPPQLVDTIRSMRAGSFEFIGLATCEVPNQGRAVHLMFRATNDMSPARASVFIQPDTEHVNIRSSACYLAGCPKHGRLVVWRTEGYVNYLYACTPPALQSARGILSVPGDEKPL